MPTMMLFHVPEVRELLAAYGELSLRHEHLNHILRMTIKSLAGLEVAEALDATAYDGAARLRERIKLLARQRLGEGEALLKLQALLERCKRASDKRNELIHSVWGKELDGEAFRRANDNTWRPLPTVAELAAVGTEIQDLTGALNDARLFGFVADALAKRPLPRQGSAEPNGKQQPARLSTAESTAGHGRCIACDCKGYSPRGNSFYCVCGHHQSSHV